MTRRSHVTLTVCAVRSVLLFLDALTTCCVRVHSIIFLYYNFKRHQGLNEILISFTHTTAGKSAKLFTRKPCHAIRLWNLTQSCEISMCACYNCTRGFHTALAWQEFSCKQFCWFPGWMGKKIQISSSHWWSLKSAASAIPTYFVLISVQITLLRKEISNTQAWIFITYLFLFQVEEYILGIYRWLVRILFVFLINVVIFGLFINTDCCNLKQNMRETTKMG